ncbi:unnamed protein product [Lactuca virosa]|uniref:F-box domain-containing protein n=1 Tax=Lactuca virosa TaxID=75947 RepID=A0AAU9PEE6_9ASTR|nr:unnamed protein product [Lactuca virosa]
MLQEDEDICIMESSSDFNLSLSSSTMEGRPNWLKLPEELMANILQRLSYLEILKSASKVCTTWKKICKDPAMWKVIDMRKQEVYRWSMNFHIETLITKLVDLRHTSTYTPPKPTRHSLLVAGQSGMAVAKRTVWFSVSASDIGNR